MNAIEISHLSKSYKTRKGLVQAVSDISLSVPEGSTLGLIGANGAGKSTMIKCILNLIKPTAGDITLFGVDANNHRSRVGVAYVAESPILNDMLTPLDILSQSVSSHKVAFDKTQAMEWLERFNVNHVANKTLGSMSKGMAQRTALAAAFVCQPKLMILDEPLSGLDPVGRKDVVDILEEYTKNGGSLLFTSHVLHDVERLADHYCIIHKGIIERFDTADDLLHQSEYRVVIADGDKLIENVVIEQSQMWEFLEKHKQQGHTILSIKPELSLEKMFYNIVSDNS